jgi:hypothetical protein
LANWANHVKGIVDRFGKILESLGMIEDPNMELAISRARVIKALDRLLREKGRKPKPSPRNVAKCMY